MTDEKFELARTNLLKVFQAFQGESVTLKQSIAFRSLVEDLLSDVFIPAEHQAIKALEVAALQSTANFGQAKNVWHPKYGWIVENYEITELGQQFLVDNGYESK